jgi:hypothetical protein
VRVWRGERPIMGCCPFFREKNGKRGFIFYGLGGGKRARVACVPGALRAQSQRPRRRRLSREARRRRPRDQPRAIGSQHPPIPHPLSVVAPSAPCSWQQAVRWRPLPPRSQRRGRAKQTWRRARLVSDPSRVYCLLYRQPCYATLRVVYALATRWWGLLGGRRNFLRCNTRQHPPKKPSSAFFLSLPTRLETRARRARKRGICCPPNDGAHRGDNRAGTQDASRSNHRRRDRRRRKRWYQK